jgi:hypothetical protein
MSRPKNKQELLSLSAENYQKLIALIEAIPPEQRESDFPPGTMNRRISDILWHLHHWHLMFMEWYEVGMSEQKPDIPAKGFTWKTVPALNREIWERYKDKSLKKSLQKLEESHREVTAIISQHTDTELFEKKRYKWTGTTSLGAYIISATSSHYDWALKLIKKASKSR